MNKIVAMVTTVTALLGSFSVQASEPIYLECSGAMATTRISLDKSEKSSTEDHGNEVIGMVINANKVRLSGGDATFSLLFPKTEFSVCKTNEVIEFYAINDQDCKLEVLKSNSTSSKSVDFYSGEYNRILNVLSISRKREAYRRINADMEVKTNMITTGGEFHCQKIKL